MKNVFASIFLLFVMASCSQNIDLPTPDNSSDSVSLSVSQVPAVVMDAFKAKYPTAGGEIEWQKEDGNTYKVKFWLGAQRWQAIFNSNGSFLSETRLK
jgi:hypothetical protein